ncbi:MAG: SIS domain-containing protein [Candidatus Aminicenantales bacterium]
MEFVDNYLKVASRIIDKVDRAQICRMIDILKEIKRDHGRIFFLGVGGSAANASHAVNDFRKICGFEAYTPVDNVSELSARTNDDGWETVFANWLKQSRLRSEDAIFVFSVGGGDLDRNVSPNIVRAVQYAKEVKAKVLGVVGRNGGHTALHADACVVIPPLDEESITPHTEAFQAVIWHLLVSHPDLKRNEMKWETVAKGENNGDIS